MYLYINKFLRLELIPVFFSYHPKAYNDRDRIKASI